MIDHNYYETIATREQHGYTEIPAQRGEIIIKDYHSNEEFLLATNTTLNLLYVDPSLVSDPLFIAEKLHPLLFKIEEERARDNERILEASKHLPKDITEEEKAKLLTPLTDAQLKEKFKQELTQKIGEKQRQKILLSNNVQQDNLTTLQNLGLTGIEIVENSVYAYPPQIKSPTVTAQKIADYVEIPSTKLAKILKGENRYVILQKKLQPEISEKIKKMFDEDKDGMFKGIGLQEEYYRYYPEGSLAANIVGYVSKENIGQYGIESSFNTPLQGEKGQVSTKRDSIGRQITVGESLIKPAVDGTDIVLTIDRSVQLKVEQILKESVEQYEADSGQVVIMNPQTGAIIAMAHYPSFNPNNYGDIFKKIEITLTPEELKSIYPTKDEGIYYVYRNEITLDRYMVFEEKDENGNPHYYRYENYVGPEAYHNKVVSWPYEPGSVFKTITMSAAIDDGDVTPNTTYNDIGPVGVDFNKYTNEYDFEIKNASGYLGLVDMKTVLAESLNTGMTFVGKKIGAALFYNYLDKFGFLDRTDIEFDTETIGQIEYFEDWTESELATHTFGQGLTVTMIQVLNAYSAIANGGILMQPYIIAETRNGDGTNNSTDPKEIRRVISEETSTKMIAMLVNSTENGVAKNAQVPNHFVAGKSGTSQTYKHGKALSGRGTTIATFAGFGPIEDPQFAILIKLDHPRSSEWCSETATPAFGRIASYLFDYYNIPPDRNLP